MFDEVSLWNGPAKFDFHRYFYSTNNHAPFQKRKSDVSEEPEECKKFKQAEAAEPEAAAVAAE